MHSHLVFVVEKPSQLRSLVPHLTAIWPNKTIYAITTMYVGLYEFRYRRGLRISDFPIIEEPAWKLRTQELSPVFEISDSEAKRCNKDPITLLQSAASIWYASDPDASGAVNFHVLLSEALGSERARNTYPALLLADLSESGIANAFSEIGTTDDEWFNLARNTGLARRFFDFNYNVNAMALLSPALRQVCNESHNYLISKYSLQLLYFIRDNPQDFTESSLISSMQNLPGTGRYKQNGLGSPASRAAIIRGLQSSGLIQGAQLSLAGRAFLNLLHPDCCDQDLQGRITEWEQDWPASKPKMERYLRTFFGKQKRFKSQSH